MNVPILSVKKVTVPEGVLWAEDVSMTVAVQELVKPTAIERDEQSTMVIVGIRRVTESVKVPKLATCAESSLYKPMIKWPPSLVAL